MTALFEGEHPAVFAKAISDEISALTPQDLAVVSSTLSGANLQQSFNLCLVGSPDFSGNQVPNKEIGCTGSIRVAYLAYAKSGRPNFWQLAQDIYNYAIGPASGLRTSTTKAFIEGQLQR